MSITVIMWLLLCVGVLSVIYGVWLLFYGLNFKKNAKEATAFVEECTVHTHTSHDSDGRKRTKRTYYLQLKLDVPDLPSVVRVSVNASEYNSVSEGQMVTVYYMPNDIKHVTLTKNHWFKESFKIFFISAWVICFVLLIEYSEKH